MHTIDIIPPAFRRRGLRVAFSLLLRAVLNLTGLAVLLPVLALVLDPAWLAGDGPLARLYLLSGIGSPRAFALTLCAAVVAVVIAKSVANHLLVHIENRYVFDLYRTLSRRLYTAYHDRGLAFVKSANSAQLARNVNVVCLAFVSGVLKPAAQIVAEALLLLLLFTALLLYAPIAALLTAAVFLPSVWLYYTLVRNRMVRLGDEENRAQREKARLVVETFRGYADIEINGAFPQMLRAFDAAMERVIALRMRDAAMRMLPQTLTEAGLAVGMALLVALSLGDDGPAARMLFGVFAVAALRLMPSVRSILAAWASIRYNRYAIELLRNAPSETQPADNAGQQPMPFERQIDVRELTFRFEDDGTELFRDFSLTIRKGERIGIRGASGAGKTTLFNLLLGLYAPTSGTIEIDGTPLASDNRRAWQRRIGYVSQHLFLTDATFAANVALGEPEERIDRARVMQALEAAQLGPFIASLPAGIDTRIGECGCRLSGGQRQRIGIARALYRRADVLFFDEATSALDDRTEEEVNRAIARLAASQPGLTLVVIAHRESSLEYCDRIVTLGK
ncbi:MAG: ABC transporter ATP-binding protein/permease [Alistipes sp.]|nr:ABC transporter ATP-binding protein/permease [Alistipes sp.]